MNEDNTPRPRFRTPNDRLVGGVRRVVLPNAVDAQADWTVGVPGGRAWRPLLLSALFTADATAGNRYTGYTITVDGQLVWQARMLQALTAGVAGRISAAGAVTAENGLAAALAWMLPLPQLWLPAGAIIASSSIFVGAADQWSAMAIWIEEAFEDDQSLSIDHADQLKAEAAAMERLGL